MTPQRLATLVAMLSAFPVNADELVDRADANGDGYVSLYELRAAYYADLEFNRRIEQSFADYDTDGDGLISEAERQAAAVATAKTTPGPGSAVTTPGETAASSTTVTPPATAAAPAAEPEPVKKMAPISSAGRPPPAADGMSSMPAPAAEPEPVKKRPPISAAGRPPPTAEGATSTDALAFTGITPISELSSPSPAAAGTAATATGAAATTGVPSTSVSGTTQTPTTVAGLSTATDTVSTGTARPNTGADRAAGRMPQTAPPARRSARALPDRRGLSRTEIMIRENDADNSGGASVSELISSGDGRQWFPDRAFKSADKNDDGELDPDELEVLLQSMERRRRR
jgi:hypothetical protein